MTETDAEPRRAPAEALAADNGGPDPSLEASAALAGRYEQLHALHEMTEAISRAEGVEGIYEVALDGLTRALHADRASILLFDEAGVIRFRAWRGLSDEYRAEVDGHSPWAPDTVDAEPIVVADAEADESVEGLRDVLRREGIAALAFVPLVYRGRLLGKFMIYYPQPHPLTEDELRLAQTIANQVAFASQRKLEEEALRESRDQLEVVFRGVADGITVQDRTGNLEGLGIPPSEQARIFEKFYRLDPNLTRGVGGTGLGLYICRELVRHMDGRVWVVSAEGEGSTFFFELPLAEG